MYSTIAFTAAPKAQSFRCPTKTSKRFVSAKAVNVEQLKKAAELVKATLKEKQCHPILIRLAWHDAGTYEKDVDLSKWPACGGANGSIRFAPEINHGANKGLSSAVAILEEVKAQVPEVGWADLMQMGSALAVEDAGGPQIPMKYGRSDVNGPEGTHPEGNLPDGDAPFGDGAATPGQHLRNVFGRMGFTDQEIVALSGAHTLGRAFKDRSGAVRKETTKYTKDGPGTPGGQSWTPEWLKFDNSYFKEVKAQTDEDLLVLQTDDTLFGDEGFKPTAEKYAESQEAFFADYALAHAKLSELGVKWEDGSPVTL